MNTGLVIIDVQRGFINEATLHIPDAVYDLQHEYDHVAVTQFYNAPGSPWRKLMDWQRFDRGGEDFKLAFEPGDHALVLEKTTYSAVTERLLNWLSAYDITQVHLCGIATDACVLKTALDLFEQEFRPVVLGYACASHGGEDCHKEALHLLSRQIGEQQVVKQQD